MRTLSAMLLATLLSLTAYSASLTLTWYDNSINELGFTIERRDGELPFVEIARTEADIEEYVDDGLLDGETYAYRVQAFNSQTVSEYSNEAVEPIPLGAPTTLVITITGNNITVTTEVIE